MGGGGGEGFAGVDDEAGVGFGTEFGEGCQVAGHGGVVGGGGLDFQGADAAAVLDDEVDFGSAGGVAVEVESGVGAAVEAVLEGLRHDEVLEEVPHEGMGGDVPRGADAEEVGGEARLGEVDFRGLDLAPSEVAVPGAEFEDDVGGAQDADPAGYRLVADARVGGEGLAVEELSGASGQELDEALEAVEVGDVHEAADVALDVGAEVVGVEAGGRDAGGPEARHAAVRQQEVAVGDGDARRGHLADGEGHQFGDAGPPRQRFADGLRQFGLVGAGEEEAARAVVGVHLRLEVFEQEGGPLDFVEYGPVPDGGDEGAGIGGGGGADVGRFEVDVALLREEGLGQGRFAGLPWAGEGHDGVVGCHFADGCRHCAFDHGMVLQCGEGEYCIVWMFAISELDSGIARVARPAAAQ